MTRHHRSIGFAVLVTPWAVPLGINLLALLFGLFTRGVRGLNGWYETYLVFAYTLPATYTAMLVFGLPYVLWLRARGALTFLTVCMGATLAAVGVSPVYVWIVLHDRTLDAGGILIYALCGLLSGVAFCFSAGIALRPQRSRESTDDCVR